MVSESQLDQLADAIAERVLARLGPVAGSATIQSGHHSEPWRDQLRPADLGYVDIHGLAKAASISPSTIYRAINAGRLTANRFGTALRFHLQTALAQISAAGELLTTHVDNGPSDPPGA